MLKLNEAKGIRVEVTDLRTNEITVYNSIRKTAEALSTDLKALRYNEKIQKFLNDKQEVLKLIEYKRKEEKARIGGIDDNLPIKNFN